MTTSRAERSWARMAEARRNRQILIECAARAFSAADGRVSLEAIARDAGVGIGTLYRHFPRREALVEAVYEDQFERLNLAAGEFLASSTPAHAFRSWMVVFMEWAATKHGMIDTLRLLMMSGRLESGRMREQLIGIVSKFLAAGVATTDFRSDVDPADIAAALVGVLTLADTSDHRDQATRILNIIVDGLRP